MLRVAHIITGLDTGGAEMMLCKLLRALDARAFDSSVISLTDVGPVGERIRESGCPVSALGMRRGVPDVRAIGRLALRLRRLRPDVVQTWMYHADLVGGLAARVAGISRLAWGIRQSTLDPQRSKRASFATVAACARLSFYLPQRIVVNSEVARRYHIGLGYAATKMVVLPNGFDVAHFKPDAEARRSVRAELDVPEQAPLVGLIARFDPQKDHRTFVEAAARIARARPDARFVLAGDGVTADNDALVGWAAEAGLPPGRLLLLGRRDDVPRLMSALDLLASSSAYGEGFPNVVGEAMAAGVPCVVTDVGDSAQVVGATGRVVAVHDAASLARHSLEILSLDGPARAALGRAARERVEALYSLPEVAGRFGALYQELLHSPSQAQVTA